MSGRYIPIFFGLGLFPGRFFVFMSISFISLSLSVSPVALQSIAVACFVDRGGGYVDCVCSCQCFLLLQFPSLSLPQCHRLFLFPFRTPTHVVLGRL